MKIMKINKRLKQRIIQNLIVINVLFMENIKITQIINMKIIKK
jgi:hypothetical protein